MKVGIIKTKTFVNVNLDISLKLGALIWALWALLELVSSGGLKNYPFHTHFSFFSPGGRHLVETQQVLGYIYEKMVWVKKKCIG